MGEPKKDAEKKKSTMQPAAEPEDGVSVGLSVAPPSYGPIRAPEIDTSPGVPYRDTRSTKQKLEDEFKAALKAYGNDVELAYDHLAQYIAKNTTQQRPSAAVAIATKHSMQLGSDSEAMGFLGDIGYWDDLPRRKVKSANDLYDQFETTDSAGKESRREDTDGTTETNALIKDIISVTNGSKEKRSQMLADRATGKKKKNFAWSATTVSKMYHSAGMGDNFAYAESHYGYSSAAKKNKRKDTGIEKLYRAFDKKNKKGEVTDAGVGVDIGDSLIRGRDKKQATYDKISQKTHGDMVVDIVIFDNEMNELGTYKALKEAHSKDKTKTDSFEDSIGTNNQQVYAVVIGGNTTDTKVEETDGKKAFSNAASDTVGKNYVALNANKTVAAKKGRNGKAYKKNEAYYGVQKTVTDDYKKDEAVLSEILESTREKTIFEQFLPEWMNP